MRSEPEAMSTSKIAARYVHLKHFEFRYFSPPAAVGGREGGWLNWTSKRGDRHWRGKNRGLRSEEGTGDGRETGWETGRDTERKTGRRAGKNCRLVDNSGTRLGYEANFGSHK